MAVALPWIMAATAVVSAAGAIQQGQATAQAEEFNANVARQNAASIMQQSEAADLMLKRHQEQQMGAAVAAYGASGAGVDSGSALDVLTDTARSQTLDRLTQKYNYQLKAIGYRTEGNLDMAGADNARTASYFNAGSSMLSGAASAIKFG